MKKALTTAREVRGILADVSDAQVHPSTIEKPEPEAPVKRKLMHAIHTALINSGRLADRNHQRKSVQWPVRGDEIKTLGYGAEKVAYRVSDSDNSVGDTVVSIYHLVALRQSPQEVIKAKRERYDTYREYFGDLVLPTQFAVVDNPWGEGAKPASIQSFIEDGEKFGMLGELEIRRRAARDIEFATKLTTLEDGYRRMLGDGICPDFATSNLLVAGSEILIFDTGHVFSAEKADQMAEIHPNYQIIENLASSMK